MSSERPANKLINEKSPYLLQHAYNPVDWHPWGEETFKKAERENKPVFLSIGYSTCHWCHVMERESFENEETAALMNDFFISVKVDREERPDIDNIYMLVCQLLTGSGGWPLSIFMTPDKKPFFAGTYFPRENKFGRIGFNELLMKINSAWREQKNDIVAGAEEITTALKNLSKSDKTEELNPDLMEVAFNDYRNRFDKIHGGFGNAPKFPSPHNLIFLLRHWKVAGNIEARDIAEKTLLEMSRGGIFDHIGYGFHRYSTDSKWLLPHFEKMLYDQAMLLHAYTEAYQATGNVSFRTVAEKIAEYVMLSMTSPEGAFYSAEDADSEGVEGKFYVWTYDEIFNVLSRENAPLFCRVFNIKESGNFNPEHGEVSGNYNIPHITEPLANIAQSINTSPEELSRKLDAMVKALFKHREARIHPFKDDKVLTDWNALMISALAKAGRIFSKSEFIRAADACDDFLEKNLYSPDGNLLHRFRGGESSLSAVLDDYAFLIWGKLELYETTFEIEYLQKALRLTDITLENFYDRETGGFFLAAESSEKLISRSKEYYDGALPSGNAVMAGNLIKISRITADSRYEEYALQTLISVSGSINKNPSAYSHSLTALNYLTDKGYEIIIVADERDREVNEILNSFSEIYLPNSSIILITKENQNKWERIAPFTRNYSAINDRPAIYVCRDYMCSLPTNDVQTALKLIL